MNSVIDGARLSLPPPLRRMGVWAWVVVGALALAVLVLGLAFGTGLYAMPFGLALIGVVLQGGSLVLGLLRARLAAGLHLVGLIMISLFSAHEPWPWPAPVVSIAALVAMLLLLTTSRHWWLSLGTWVVACLSLTVIATLVGPGDGQVLGNLTVTASLSFAALIIGLLITLWWRASADLGEARIEARQQHAARTWAEERSRVAREMHDVVAHSMSLVHMRATSARYRIPDLPHAAIDELDGIANQAREALAQMRGVLGVLRGDDESQLQPLPQLQQLPDLVQGAQDANINLIAEIDEVIPPVPQTVQLALYRVAQEAIANVVRHSPQATVTLRLEAADRLTLTVLSKGEVAATSPDSGGTGIRGMMERMAAIGGTFRAGPIDGGFEVVAIAPRAQ
ncbi:MAG: sensor histidine kinase [Beutenbergiaceae bacterium]